MNERPLGICMVGYGFMGKAHSNAIARLPMFFPEAGVVSRMALCGPGLPELALAAAQYGWESYSEDIEASIAREDIDIVDIVSPTDTHAPLARLAAKHGKHVLCEKPMSADATDALAMLDACRVHDVRHQVGFNYRFAPAIQLMKRMTDEGRLGRVDHFRARYLQDWLCDEGAPFTWRLDKALAGAGALGDLGAHAVDLALWLVGDIQAVQASARRFVPERADAQGYRHSVTVDDALAGFLDFSCGTLGTLEVSRNAQGHRNALTIELNGTIGSLRFDLERMNELWFFDATRPAGEAGWTNILVTHPDHPYGGRWWPDGHIIGYEHTLVHEYAAFIAAIRQGEDASPSFEDGLRCARVLDALEAAAESGGRVPIIPVT